MTDNRILAGGGLVRDAAGELARRPVHATALVAAALITILVAPLWGLVLTRLGWLTTREKISTVGVFSLGEVLAPQRARDEFKDGVWRGLWRVHGVAVAFGLVQAPVALLVLLPAVVAFVLFKSVAPLFPQPMAALAVSSLLPAAVAIACITVAAGQTVLAYRIMRATPAEFSLGLIHRITAAAWRITLDHITTLASLGIFLTLAAVAGGATVAALGFLAGWLLPAGGQGVIITWLAVPLAIAVLYLAFEAVTRWSDGIALPEIDDAGCYSFSAWLWTWLASVFGWFKQQGMLSVGTGACLVFGLLVGLFALASQQIFTSWVGLGWFTVSAAVLVTIRLWGSKK